MMTADTGTMILHGGMKGDHIEHLLDRIIEKQKVLVRSAYDMARVRHLRAYVGEGGRFYVRTGKRGVTVEYLVGYVVVVPANERHGLRGLYEFRSDSLRG